ncbi:aldo/keto reductase [Nonomuraea sp. MCN248]|uniref:Aldo/keto reductase n=1 Tax=Nonomuraea corallina TaxID=2989783 RepID=A0ABT4S6V6_9ACTN|nr:aldo/keto reductase [Nonomuraea corallina]MDA0632735.1 aldo/keto reductase [Nonomuraea corallina]
MKTVQLGRTGEQISQLALGCMIMGTVTPEDESFAILDRYAETGGAFLDTADCYAWWERRGSLGGHSEELIGRWLARTGRRDRVFLATKGSAVVRDLDAVWAGGRPDWEVAYRTFVGAGAKTLRDAIDGSLRRLGTDHVDLYYVHVDDRATPLEETLEALAGIVRAGKARYIGWSNARTWRLERIRHLCAANGWPAPVALQQQHSYLRRRAGLRHVSIVDDEQLDYLAAHDDLTLVAYSPILKGVYDDTAKRRGHGVMEPYVGPDAEARLAAVAEVAAEVGVTPNALVLAWLQHQTSPAVVPLIGPRTLGQYEAALPALDVRLTADQLARLDAAGA